jgi:ubiquinone/menaquinone biosynthesis C-methylase UbiE
VKSGVLCVQGIAEFLPFKGARFDYALIVTTICFVDDPKALLAEAYRVLKPGAPLVIGFINRTSALGRYYLDHRADNIFYRNAIFYSAAEVGSLLLEAGFSKNLWGNTLSMSLNEFKEIECFRGGLGQGAFVVVKATKA